MRESPVDEPRHRRGAGERDRGPAHGRQLSRSAAGEGPTGASALDFSNTVGNAAASLCGIEFGLRGINVTIGQKEASALSAMAHAASVLRAGRARAIVTGGVDDFEELFFTVYDQFRALATDEGVGEASRPFDRRRNGFVLGCGAFMVVLESGLVSGTPAYGRMRTCRVWA